MNAEAALQDYLNSLNYSIDARPITNSSLPILVWIAVKLFRIVDFTSDERLSVMATITTAWIDQFKVWNPADYGGIKIIYRRADTIWRSTPFTLWNTASSSVYYTLNGSHPIILQHDGTMAMDITSTYTVICHMDVKYFPWDIQQCQLQVKPSVMDVNHMVFVPAVNAALFAADPSNSEWRVAPGSVKQYVQNVTVTSGLVFPTGKPSNFVLSVYYLNMTLERRPEFYIFNVIAPVCILTALSVLALFVPNSRGEQIGLTISVFLSFTVFQSYVNNFVPRASEIPMITIYILWQLAMSALCVTSGIVSLLLHDTERTMPHCLRSVLHVLAQCLFVYTGQLDADQTKPVSTNSSPNYFANETALDDVIANNGVANVLPTAKGLTQRNLVRNCSVISVDENNALRSSSAVLFGGHGVSMLPNFYRSSHHSSKTCNPDWALMSDVLNRLVLILSFLTIMIVSLYFLLTMSNNETRIRD